MTLSGGRFVRRFWRALLIVGILAAFILGYLLGGGPQTPPPAPPADTAAVDHDHAGKKAEVVWTCAMHPQIRLPEPGQCPICFMDLIPLTPEAGGGEQPVSLRQITLSPQAQRLAEVVVAPVRRRPVSVETRLTGKVAYDETRLGYITAWIGGRIDELAVNYTGTRVSKGQPMASIYSPDLLTAQAELIQAAQAVKNLERSNLPQMRDIARRTEEASREKLRRLGLSAQQIDRVMERGVPADHVTLHAPLSGVVIDMNVREGMYVDTGSRLFTIADLSTVWVVLQAYESDLPWIKLGQKVNFTVEAIPGDIFTGEVVYVDPTVDPTTRTIRVRLNVPNEHGRLKPGMFVNAVQRLTRGGQGEPLVIPASAPLLTGKRAVVYVASQETPGLYEGREVVLGPRAGNFYIVREGLAEGEMVVTNGNFKIDSAVQIQARPSMMTPGPGGTAQTGHQHEAQDMAPRAQAMELTPEVPMAFARQLPPLAEDFEVVRKAVGGTDLHGAREAFKSFYDDICAVDPTAITDADTAMLWKEISMLLRNDTLIGSEAEDMPEARRMFETFQGHFARLEAGFPLKAELGPELLPAPEEFRKQLADVYTQYLTVRAALAGDDFRAAHAAAKLALTALSAVKGEKLSAKAAEAWSKARDRMSKGLSMLERSKDLDGARHGFLPFSEGLTMAIERLGMAGGTPVYEMFCPMAFDNKGATWLQSTQDISNPYFGAAMLGCGELRREFPAAPATAETEPAKIETPAAFRAQLGNALREYLKVHAALAADRLQDAKRASAALAEALDAVDMTSLGHEAHLAWMDALKPMGEGLRRMNTAGDLEGIRQGFEPVSVGLAKAMSTLGAEFEGPLYEMYCPMAFANKGATWLQAEEEVANPYFGEAMLRCGEIKRRMGAKD